MNKVKERCYLDCRYDARKSFYNKAEVINFQNGSSCLKSYSTIVMYITKEGKLKIRGKYSQTTTRHMKEYIRQFTKYGYDETDTLSKVLKLGDDK